MLHDPWFYAAAIPAVIIVGLSKGGFGGGGLLGTPLLALVVPPLEAAAIMLPIMIAMDLVALHAWWGIFDRRSVAILVPSSIVGIAIGWAIAAYVSDDAVKLIVGIVALGFILNYVLSGGRRGAAKAPGVRSEASPVSSATPAARRCRCICCRCGLIRRCSQERRCSSSPSRTS
jgi:uncharacterized protein